MKGRSKTDGSVDVAAALPVAAHRAVGGDGSRQPKKALAALSKAMGGASRMKGTIEHVTLADLAQLRKLSEDLRELTASVGRALSEAHARNRDSSAIAEPVAASSSSETQ
jgi:hypothetical protein